MCSSSEDLLRPNVPSEKLVISSLCFSMVSSSSWRMETSSRLDS
ncbi:unnamed protein product [Spirodela intermedia]|uniref:Uncharacterized protein n=1 Tax=Spirodela intermedia TaxID=51605 RepID=A0A7I8K1U5_SPIIN|nr:unnamed protein product [Spirodela intermedia]